MLIADSIYFTDKTQDKTRPNIKIGNGIGSYEIYVSMYDVQNSNIYIFD